MWSLERSGDSPAGLVDRTPDTVWIIGLPRDGNIEIVGEIDQSFVGIKWAVPDRRNVVGEDVGPLGLDGLRAASTSAGLPPL